MNKVIYLDKVFIKYLEKWACDYMLRNKNDIEWDVMRGLAIKMLINFNITMFNYRRHVMACCINMQDYLDICYMLMDLDINLKSRYDYPIKYTCPLFFLPI